MKTINVSDIKYLYDLGKGNFSEVSCVLFNRQKYAFKYFTEKYPKPIMDNIISLTDKDYEKEFIVPQYIVLSNSGDIIGYLSKYNEKLVHINNVESIKDKIKLLKSAKSLMKKMHKKHHIIHGDISKDNFLYDIESKKAYLIDFDFASTKNNEILYKDYFRWVAREYIENYSYDDKLDNYMFNLATLMSLSKYCDCVQTVIDNIRYCDYFYFRDYPKLKKVTKELILTPNKSKNKFIIDYL